ncbi:MAG: hypothetical protein MUF06_22460 [Pirellulaceae bacterium]|nr:hypothetical protein [Pirellulaceae bacterium]
MRLLGAHVSIAGGDYRAIKAASQFGVDVRSTPGQATTALTGNHNHASNRLASSQNDITEPHCRRIDVHGKRKNLVVGMDQPSEGHPLFPSADYPFNLFNEQCRRKIRNVFAASDPQILVASVEYDVAHADSKQPTSKHPQWPDTV